MVIEIGTMIYNDDKLWINYVRMHDARDLNQATVQQQQSEKKG